MIVSERYKFLFFELPRTGTTSIAEVLIGNGIGERYPGDRHLSISEYCHDHNGVPAGWKIVSCIRNPMDRVLSLYVKMRQDQNSYYSRLRGREKRTLAQRRLVRHYELIQRNQWEFERYFLNMYKWPYTDWMYRDSMYCDYIVRFERLAEDYDRFMRGVEVPVVPALPRSNRTEDKENAWDSCSAVALKRAAWVFGPYLHRFGWEYPVVTDVGIARLQSVCFTVIDYLYTVLRRVNGHSKFPSCGH